MEHRLRMPIILLLLIAADHMTQVTLVQTIYKKTEPGQNITGKIGGETGVQSEIECARKCAGATKCETYKYQGTGPGNCLLIQPNCSNLEGPIFEQGKDDVIFDKVNLVDSPRWIQPKCWTGPKAALYQSFNGSQGLVLMEGSMEVIQIPLVTGKVGGAWSFSRTQNQWVDFGNNTGACMARPETCGAAGGAISVWIKVIDCSLGDGGIISSSQDGVSTFTSSLVYCSRNDTVVLMYLPDGFFYLFTPRPAGWIHLTLNYIRPENGQGIMIYHNGKEVASTTSKYGGPHSAGDGRIVVGRFYTNKHEKYGTVQIDELIFFNKALTSTDIKLLYNEV